jgi:hypothetical protein
LLSISAAFFIAAVHSEKFAAALSQYAVDLASAAGQLKITLNDFSGTIADGLTVKSIRVMRRHPALDVTINELRARLNFNRLVPAGVISLSGSSGHIEVTGLMPSGFKFSEVPPYRGPACFANLPANFEIQEFSISSIKFVPWPELPAVISIGSFSMAPGQPAGDNIIALAASATWRDLQIASGTLSGAIKPRQNRFQGTVDLCLAGQKLSSEICLQQKRRTSDLSGHISSASIDLSALSLWLGPLWQNEFPFGFDGRLDCSGSWLFNSELGFLGNLSGKCQSLRLVALGFYFSLAELNGNWKLFDGNLLFEDKGSYFAGFPAALEGSVESVMKPERYWHLNFACPVIDFAQLSEVLPWGLKYSLNLPELSGSAALSLSLNGKLPELIGKAATNGIKIGKSTQERLVSGRVVFVQNGLGSSSLELDFKTVAERALPPFFNRFNGRTGSLVPTVAKAAGPFTFHWKMSGVPESLKFSGGLAAGMVDLISNEGAWNGGIGHVRAFSLSSQASQTWAADGVTFLDLFLTR